MFSFPEDAPSARRLAEAWGATEGSFVALPGSTAPLEFPRTTALFRSRGLPTFPGGTEGMEGSSSGIRGDRRDHADYGGGSLSRFPSLPGYQTDGGWSAQVPFGDRLAQAKQTFKKNGTALRTPSGFWTLTAAGRLASWFRHQKRLPSLARSRCAAEFFTVSIGRRTVSVCGPTIWAFFESLLFYAPDAGGRTVPPGPPPILQDDSPLPLWMFRGGHQFVGLLLAVRSWDPGGHFGFFR